MVISKKNRIKMFLVSTLMIFSMCFLISVEHVKACESVRYAVGGAGAEVVSFSADELPKEITEPIEKGTKLMEYLVGTLGGIVVLVGLILLAISFFGHQNEMKITGFIALGAGLVILAAPSIVDWLKS
ncbi:MAG: hypothetical protein IJX85_11185 [Lachnospiraceae bacterium]|nr:hypothetical protein [Lachnospiraceae bacterium]